MLHRAILMCGLLTVASTSPGAAPDCDTRFNLANQSGQHIAVVNFEPSRPDYWIWGENRLGQDGLANGTTQNFRSRAAGRHDFRVVFEDGSSVERLDVNVCVIGTVTVNERSITAR